MNELFVIFQKKYHTGLTMLVYPHERKKHSERKKEKNSEILKKN